MPLSTNIIEVRAKVRAILGASTDHIGALCVHPNVNRWSKYKPVNSTSRIGLTPQQFANLKYGINIMELFGTVGPAYNSANWAYNKPSSLNPKRIGDFRSYEHTAPVPLLQNHGTGEIVFAKFVNVNTNIQFDILRFPTGLEDYCLNISNIATEGGDVVMGNYYLAADIYPRGATSGSPIETLYSLQKIGYSTGTYDEDARGIRLSEPSIPSGNYEYHLYMSTHNETVPAGELRKNYPINWTSAYPNKINMAVKSLADQFEISFIGIMPSTGTWPDGTTSPKIGALYNSGNYSSTDFGTLKTFIARFSIKNKTGQTVYIPRSDLRVKYSFLNTWADTELTETYGSAASGSNIVISNNATVYFNSAPLRLLPLNIPLGNVNVDVIPNYKIYYYNSKTPIGGDPYEPFTHVSPEPVVSLNYTNI